jgi:AraC-like DNA-binding protein
MDIFQSKRWTLDAFPVIRTADVDEMREAIGRFYGEVRLSVDDSRSFQAHGNHCQLNAIGISFATYGAGVDHFYPSMAANYTVPLAARGAGWGKTGARSVDINQRQTLVGAPHLPAEFHVGPEFEELSVQFDATTVQRTLAGLIGAEVNGTLVFEPVMDLEKPANQLWLRLLRFLVREAETREDDLPLAALGEIEQALILMFLKANRHSFSSALEARHGDAAPRQVRQAEEYIEAHWDGPISVEILAQVTSASARSVFAAFRKSRGYSPMAFVKRVRLRHARRMLLAREPGTTVADVAFTCGFGNLGNFAKDYREAFGELPSATLRSSPGLLPEFGSER